MTQIENGTITGADIFVEDHGCLTFSLDIEFDGSRQAYGGYSLDNDKGGPWIHKLLDALKVNAWSQLKGRTIRVRRDNTGGLIRAVGHAVKDSWFEVK